MRFAVLYSRQDVAGKNIAGELVNFYLPHVPVIVLHKDSIHSENIDKDTRLKEIDFIIFATKHQSKEQRKTLSLHAPGNWRSQKSEISDDSQNSERILKNADLGGKPGHVCPTSALIMKYLFQELARNAQEANSDYEVTLECTHHGPFLEKPCCFIEIGSSPEQWQDKEAAKIICKTIASLQNYEKKLDGYKVAVFLGGPHYAPNANKIQLNSEYAIGHIIPEYALPLTESMLKEALAKTEEPVEIILLDWKGLGRSEDREKILSLLKHSSLEYKRTSEVEK